MSKADPLAEARVIVKTPFRGSSGGPIRPKLDARAVGVFCRWWRGEASQSALAAELGISQGQLSRLFKRIRAEVGETR